VVHVTANEDIREIVRQRYAESARQLATVGGGESCCGSGTSCCVPDTLEGNVTTEGTVIFGSGLYSEQEVQGVTAAVEASLGCGVPTAVADLHEGETVLDLGSGAGGDVLISARRVGPTGLAIGLDMTTEMLELARKNAHDAGVVNVEFLQGYLEDIPLPDASVDVVISNCVINLAADKRLVLAEAARVTRPGGRFAVSDVVADVDMDEATRADLAAYTGCIAGALTEQDYRDALVGAGWTDVEVRPTHRVHAHAQAAIVRAVRA
jgi:SAM-dependent methyltransferase